MAPMEPLLLDILIAQLRELGLEDGAEPSEVPQTYLRQWVRHVGDFVDIHSHATPSLETAWQAWDDSKSVWLAETSRCAQVTLAETAMRALPTILNGQKPATSVLMPNVQLIWSRRFIPTIWQRNILIKFWLQPLFLLCVNALKSRYASSKLVLELGQRAPHFFRLSPTTA